MIGFHPIVLSSNLSGCAILKENKITNIRVYGKDGCAACSQTTAHLKSLGIDFMYINTSEDSLARETIQNSGYKSLPVVFSGMDSWSGYRPDLINGIV